MKALKWLLGIVLVAIAASVLLRAFARTHKDPPDQDEDQEEAVQSRSRVSVIDGHTVLTLSEATQRRLGIADQALRRVETRQETTAAATVLPVQTLVTLRNAVVAAQVNVQKAAVSVDLAKKEYERLRKLYQENQNVSQKSVQAAKATLRTDEATLQATQQEFAVQKTAAGQSWGGVVASWVAAGAPELARVLNQELLLVEVTVSPSEPFAVPRRISLSIPEGGTVHATYVSPFPIVDPRIQGIAFLYSTLARPGISAGMNLVARLPVGPRLTGVLVPRRAMVWWQGHAWVYEQTAPTEFIRRAVSTENPLVNGYFAGRGFAPGDKVVVVGPQILLSTEFSSETEGAGGED